MAELTVWLFHPPPENAANESGEAIIGLSPD